MSANIICILSMCKHLVVHSALYIAANVTHASLSDAVYWSEATTIL